MEQAQKGDIVKIFFEGRIKGGESFDSTADDNLLEFPIGSNTVMPAIENSIIGMSVGEEKTLKLQPEDAFGPHDKELMHTVSRDVLGSGVVPQQGMVLGLNIEKDGKKEKIPATITEISGDLVTVDFNHPLAGKTISYRIILKSITEKTD